MTALHMEYSSKILKIRIVLKKLDFFHFNAFFLGGGGGLRN
jgi:hypothetical protein